MTATVLMATPLGTSSARSDDRPDGVLFREGFDDARLPRARLVRRRGVRHPRDGCPCGRRLHRLPLEAGHDDAGRLVGPAPAVRADGYGLPALLPQAVEGLGLDRARRYHPHLIHFLTTENGKYHGPAASHLTVYIEPQEGRLRLAAQDIQNRDAPHGLTQGPLRGGYNGTFYDSEEVLFTDDAWHCVEAHVPPELPRPRAGSSQRGRHRARLVRRQARRGAHGRGPALDRFPGHEVQPVPARALLRPRPAAPRADPVDRRAGRRDRATRCHHGPGVPEEDVDASRRGPAQEPDDRLPAGAAEVLARVDRSLDGAGATRPQGRGRRLRRPGAAGGHPRPAQLGGGEPAGPRRGAPRGRAADARPARQGGGGPSHVPGPLQRRHRAGRALVQHRVPARPRRPGDRPLPEGEPAADRAGSHARPRRSRSSPRRTSGRSAC